MEVMDDVAEVPLVVSIDWGRVFVIPDIGSALLVGHGPARWFFFRAAAVPPQEFTSPDVDVVMGTPLVSGTVWDMVEVEDVDDVEDIDEEELARCALFRGMNIRATSSAFIAVSPPWLALHADRLFCWKLGKFATAVICHDVWSVFM